MAIKNILKFTGRMLLFTLATFLFFLCVQETALTLWAFRTLDFDDWFFLFARLYLMMYLTLLMAYTFVLSFYDVWTVMFG